MVFGGPFDGLEVGKGEEDGVTAIFCLTGAGGIVRELTEAGGAEYWTLRGWKKDRIDG